MYEHGAHVTSWRDPAGIELLFVSKEVRGCVVRYESVQTCRLTTQLLCSGGLQAAESHSRRCAGLLAAV